MQGVKGVPRADVKIQVEQHRVIAGGRCARVRLTGVVVRNAGVDWADPGNCYWRHRVARREAARIALHGQAEFEASHVVLSGNQTFEARARDASP